MELKRVDWALIAVCLMAVIMFGYKVYTHKEYHHYFYAYQIDCSYPEKYVDIGSGVEEVDHTIIDMQGIIDSVQYLEDREGCGTTITSFNELK